MISLPVIPEVLARVHAAILDNTPPGRWRTASWTAYRWLSSVEHVSINDDGHLVVPSKGTLGTAYLSTANLCQCAAFDMGMEQRDEPYPCWHRQAANYVSSMLDTYRAEFGHLADEPPPLDNSPPAPVAPVQLSTESVDNAGQPVPLSNRPHGRVRHIDDDPDMLDAMRELFPD